MEQIVTLAEFSNTTEIKFNMLKALLDEAKIEYMVMNEQFQIEPVAFAPSNFSIEVRVDNEDYVKAKELLDSIN